MYQHHRAGSYELEEYGRSSMFFGALEPIARRPLTADLVESAGLALVRAALGEFWTRPELPRDWKSPVGKALSPKDYRCVFVRSMDDGSLELDPCLRGTRGGYVGSLPDERLRVPADATADQFAAALVQAFERAGGPLRRQRAK
jgi:hypothetical protein